MQTFNKITLQSNGEYKSSDNANGTVSTDRYTLICAENGFLIVNTNNSKLLFNGKCLLVNNGVNYTVRNVNKNTSSFIILSIDKNFIDGFIKGFTTYL